MKLLKKSFLKLYEGVEPPMTELGKFVYYRTYSRYLPKEKRRESWLETCARAVEYNCSLDPNAGIMEAEILFDNMFNLRQFLSGRTLWVGGTKVAEDFPMANFNCSFQIMDRPEKVGDLLYLLMLGTGVGIRILKSDVKKLPKINQYRVVEHLPYIPKDKKDRQEYTSLVFDDKKTVRIVIGDSKLGWADAIRYFIKLVIGQQYSIVDTVKVDYNSVRPAGEPLKTFGGTASGHEALETIIRKLDLIISVAGLINPDNKLLPIDMLDICTAIAEGVVVGGVRRSAVVSLIDTDDEDCLTAKDNLYKQNENGEWSFNKSLSHRSMSNNTVIYNSKPKLQVLKDHLAKMRYTGEPALMNMESARKRFPEVEGGNPCMEILLPDQGVCNLTTVNVMNFVKNGILDVEGLLLAQCLSVRAGVRMTLLNLELPDWNDTQEKYRLTGCSLTGWQDMVNAVGMSNEDEIKLLSELKKVAKKESVEYASYLGIPTPRLVTTIKPEGTISQLPTVSSGIHYSHSPYYIRRIRINSKDPLVKVCQKLGYKVVPEVGHDPIDPKTMVVEFPVKAPDGKSKGNVSAIEQLEAYKRVMAHYVDHNCSITVHVRDNEWDEIAYWLYDNWDDVVAISFLPFEDGRYELMPYEEITQKEYESLLSSTPTFEPELLSEFENYDFDLGDEACDTGVCPIK